MNDFQEQCQIVFHATVFVGGYVFKTMYEKTIQYSIDKIRSRSISGYYSWYHNNLIQEVFICRPYIWPFKHYNKESE